MRPTVRARVSGSAHPRTLTLVLLATLLVGSSRRGLAQSEEELKDMSLGELLDLEVTAATKTKGFSTRKAPSVIRVFTRRDLDQFAFQTIRDVLANVPGIQVQEYRGAHQSPWIRGVKSRYNNKILWLIDGVPLRDSYYGHSSIDEILPLDMVERIEIISGPGSVLYGANAFAGVVSIVTRKAQDVGKGERAARASFGSYDTAEAAGEFARKNVYAYANYYSSSGFSPELNADGKTWPHAVDSDRTYALIKVGPENLQGTFSFADYSYPERYRKSGRDRFLERRPAYGSLHYRKDVGPRGNLSLLGYYESYDLRKEETRFGDPGVVKSVTTETLDSSLFGADLDFSYEAGGHLLVTGTSFQIDKGSDIHLNNVLPNQSERPGLAVSGVARHDVGLFVQDIWSLNSSIDLSGGIRYDYLSDFENQFSYRVGLTGRKGDVYGKLLYGTAFRVPSYREYLDVISFNVSLQPEHLTTFEAQIGTRFSKGDVNLTVYNNRYDDLIKELFVDVIREPEGTRVLGDEYSINADTSTITGVEIQTTLFPTERLSLNLGAATILDAKETIGPIDPSIVTSRETITEQTDSLFLSDFTANALLSYRFSDRNHRIGLNAVYFSDRSVPGDYQSSVPNESRNPANAEGFVSLDAFSTVHFLENLSLNFKFRNVLDRRIYSPPFDDATQYDVECRAAPSRQR